MGAAETVAASALITRIRYELYDNDLTQYTDAELLAYINKSLEIIHELLIDEESELIRTGTGSFTTTAGTQSYDLSANTMGDLWLPYRVWISEYEPMTVCEEEDLYDAINEEEKGSTGHRTRPEVYCIVGEYMWFEDVPDDTYTVNLKYYPNFVPLASTASNMPLRNLFNQAVIEGVKVLAKHRNEQSVHVDAILKDIFQERALRIMRKRRKQVIKISPKLK